MLPETSILAYVVDLDDPRIVKNHKHPLINIITIGIMGVISGPDTWVNIERYGNANAALMSFQNRRYNSAI